MPERFEPKTAKPPKAHQEIWSLLAPTVGLSYVLYKGTAVVLYLGHRVYVDFDFFRSAPLDKGEVESSFEFIRGAQILQEDMNTLVVTAVIRRSRGVSCFKERIACGQPVKLRNRGMIKH
jgi:hypothetical protein